MMSSSDFFIIFTILCTILRHMVGSNVEDIVYSVNNTNNYYLKDVYGNRTNLGNATYYLCIYILLYEY